jgi:predicted phage terminase large subunit-like protein
MTQYNFAAQYQQDPEPPSGIIVKREWLRFYGPSELPQKFDQIVQSWDTANKDSELANFSVCTTWGLKNQRMYLLDVFRRKLDFPDLKRCVRELADRHHVDVVLVEDKASGTSLIQELRGEGFWKVQPAPALEGDKIMRLHGQTAKIEGGFALFPNQAPWLDAYVHELVSFPNAKNDDQVDSTVFALAWSTQRGGAEAWLEHYRRLSEEANGNQPRQPKMIRVWVPPPSTHQGLIKGEYVALPADRIIEVTEEDAIPILQNGGRRVTDTK